MKRLAVAHATPTFDTLPNVCAKGAKGLGCRGGLSLARVTSWKKNEAVFGAGFRRTRRRGGEGGSGRFSLSHRFLVRGKAAREEGPQRCPSRRACPLASTNSGISTCLGRHASPRGRAAPLALPPSASSRDVPVRRIRRIFRGVCGQVFAC